MIVNVSEAKAKLSHLIDMVCHGETVVIAKNSLPLVELVPHRRTGRRRLGFLSGEFTVPEDFTSEDGDINAMFEGEGK